MRNNYRRLSIAESGEPRPWGGPLGQLDPAALRTAWSRETTEGGWTRPGDWWAPEVDSLAEAVARGLNAVPAAGRLGRVRADAGVGAQETLNDLCALYRLLPGGGPPLPVVRSLIEAWADATVAAIQTATCEDPLSGLTSAAYLRTRLAEIYREAGRAEVAAGDRNVLLVVDLGPAGTESGWEGLLFRLTLGDCLRAVFAGGETLAAVGPRTVLGLVGRDHGLPRRVEALRARLAQMHGAEGVKVWLDRLPDTLRGALDTVAAIDAPA